MSIVVTERFGSGSSVEGESPSVELLYQVDGTNSDIDAKIAMSAASPLLYDGLIRQTSQIEPVGPFIWNGSVTYGLRKPPETGDSSFNFDTGGGTQHLTQSLETVGKYAPPDMVAGDFKGAIQVDKDGKPEGVDVTTPIYSFSETHYVDAELVTGEYKGTLFGLTGRVNDAEFRGFAAGEVLFLGATGAKRGEEDWEITFRFAASPNVVNLDVGDIVVTSKKGWEYLWVRYEESEDEDAVPKCMVSRPVAAYVEKVYHDGDFSGLGIGG